jgi:MFS family permease
MIYVYALGANPLQLGYINSLSGFMSAIISVPTGWLADKYNQKKVLIGTLLLHILVPFIYSIAWNWQITIPAVALSTALMYLMWTISNIFIADSTKSRERGSGFAIIQSFSQISSIASPLIAGYIISTLGGISVQNIKPLFYIQIVGVCLLSFFAYQKIVNVPLKKKDNEKTSIISDFREIFRDNTSLKKFILLRCFNGFKNFLVSPFIMIYANEIKGVNAFTIGVMDSALQVIATLVAIPLGRFSDKFGRRRLIFLQEISLVIRFLLLLFAPFNKPEYLILGWAISGIAMGGMGWSTMTMEMVPAGQRGRWSGISQLFNGMAMIPAPIIGGFLWTNLSPNLPFILYIFIVLFMMIPLLLIIPETLERHN